MSKSSPIFNLEWAIIKDKLSQGVNGVEWLVLNCRPKERHIKMLPEWIEMLHMYGHHDTDQVMRDSLRMDSDSFYAQYEFNWWMAVSHTLAHLYLLRERSYDRYFEFLLLMERKKTMNGYDILLKLGRKLGNHKRASELAKSDPQMILSAVTAAERALLWKKVSDFFSLFPPIKRYDDDGSWDYHSTMKMIQEDLGTTFGKDDLKMLLMSRCYENRFIGLVGLAYMLAVSEMWRRTTGEDAFTRFIRKGKEQ